MRAKDVILTELLKATVAAKPAFQNILASPSSVGILCRIPPAFSKVEPRLGNVHANLHNVGADIKILSVLGKSTRARKIVRIPGLGQILNRPFLAALRADTVLGTRLIGQRIYLRAAALTSIIQHFVPEPFRKGI